MTRQRSSRLGRAIPSLGVVGCAFALGLSLSASAQDSFDDDPFVEEVDPFGERFFDPMDYTASGEVDRVDLPEGKLVVDGRTYRADPRALLGLQPGQQVYLMYEPFQDQAWIRDLQLEEGYYEGDAFWGPVY